MPSPCINGMSEEAASLSRHRSASLEGEMLCNKHRNRYFLCGDKMYLTASNPICKHPIQPRSLKMAPRMSKDSDTMSRASTLQGIATTDFAPRTAHKTNEFVALQTLLETPEIQATVSASSNTSETLVESQSTIKRNKRRTVYWIVGLTTFASLIVLAAILGVILGPRRVSQHSAR